MLNIFQRVYETAKLNIKPEEYTNNVDRKSSKMPFLFYVNYFKQCLVLRPMEPETKIKVTM